VESILTDEHKELINKKIKKAINDLDFTEILAEYIEKELDTIYYDSNIKESLESMVMEVIRQNLVKSGLLKDK
jgi:predicted transcriptional regulator